MGDLTWNRKILKDYPSGKNTLASLLIYFFPLGSPEGYNSDQSGTVRGTYCCPHYDPTKHTALFGFDKGHKRYKMRPNLMYMWRAMEAVRT